MSSSEQTERLDQQMAGTVAQMDKMTQQNAAMVQESAAGAMSLTDETQHLRTALAVFKLQPKALQ